MTDKSESDYNCNSYESEALFINGDTERLSLATLNNTMTVTMSCSRIYGSTNTSTTQDFDQETITNYDNGSPVVSLQTEAWLIFRVPTKSLLHLGRPCKIHCCLSILQGASSIIISSLSYHNSGSFIHHIKDDISR
jgi:hypothetical protein